MPSLMVYETGNETDPSSEALNTTLVPGQLVCFEQARIVVGQALLYFYLPALCCFVRYFARHD